MAGERRHEVDWVRVVAMLAVLVFHTARAFDHEGWHVKNPELSLGATVLVGVLVTWIMPIFFVLSGIGSFHSKKKRSAGQYTLARVRRLLVPFAFGTLVLIPPQVYIERASHGAYAGSFLSWLPQYFDGCYGFGGNFAWMGLHLWYLLLLFLFSLLTLPIFARLAREAGGGGWLARRMDRAGAVFLLALPLAGMELLADLHPQGLGLKVFGGWSILVYLVFFLLGFTVARSETYRRAIQRHRHVALVAALGLTGLVVSGWLITPLRQALGSTAIYWLGGTLRPLAAWCWIVALLGYGSRHLSFRNRFLAYANEMLLPFYILHQSVIVVFAYLMLDWDLAVLAKYLVLLTASFLGIMAIYEPLVRRIGPLRFVFGMVPRGTAPKASSNARSV